jgi:hypothetical protein
MAASTTKLPQETAAAPLEVTMTALVRAVLNQKKPHTQLKLKNFSEPMQDF